MTTKRPSQKNTTFGSELTSVPPIEPLKPPSFPTFFQLVEEDANKPAPPSRKIQSLFDGTLGDLPRLLADFQESPEKYGDELHPLLQRLMSGNTSVAQLSTNEKRLLDLATFDYWQTKPKKAETPRATPKRQAQGQTKREEEKEEPGPRPGIDVPVTELPAYWWLR